MESKSAASLTFNAGSKAQLLKIMESIIRKTPSKYESFIIYFKVNFSLSAVKKLTLSNLFRDEREKDNR